MSRVALPGGLPAVTTANAGAQPSGSFPISGRGLQLTLVGQFRPTAFTTERGLVLLDGTLAGTVTVLGGQTQTVTGLAVRLPLRSMQATCPPATVTIVAAPTAVLVSSTEPSFDDMVFLEGVTLTRPVDPADTGAVAEVCALASMLGSTASPNPNGLARSPKRSTTSAAAGSRSPPSRPRRWPSEPPWAMASPRNLAIGILRLHGDRSTAAALRRNARDATRVLPLLGVTSP